MGGAEPSTGAEGRASSRPSPRSCRWRAACSRKDSSRLGSISGAELGSASMGGTIAIGICAAAAATAAVDISVGG